MAAKRRPPMVPDDTAPESMRAICRNVVVSGRRTSIRMEPLLWESLGEICRREGRATNDVVALVDARRGDSALTAALRIFILSYFRHAAAQVPVPTARLHMGLAEEQSELLPPTRPQSQVFKRALTIFADDEG